jgi:2-(1,2-epoxy-1,2-dihydrophenyl)acetyl-CoA isomerase
MENRTVGADEALRLGLVGEVVDDEQFDARLAEYCALIAERSPIGARLTKRGILNATTGIDLEMHVRFEIRNIMRAFDSNDHEEARKAFFERRAPSFEGR